MARGIALTIDKKSSIAEMLRSKKKSHKNIAVESGVSEITVARINTTIRANGTNTGEVDLDKRIMELIEDGCSMNEISEALLVTKKHIKRIIKRMRAVLEEADDDGLIYAPNNEDFLKKNWHWKMPEQARRRINPETGCRIVYVGERSNFRTPYRPDGVWR